MTLQIADRIKETTTTTGTGPLTLAGAITGYRAFSSACAVNDLCYYALQAVDASGIPTGDWEVGVGAYSATNTLTRIGVLSSSNAGALVNLAAGTKHVWMDWPGDACNSASLGGFKNKIIGGDFSTNPWQRGTGFSFVGSTNNGYSADRWAWSNSGTANVNITKDSPVISIAQAGRLVTASLLIQVTVADVTSAPTDTVFLDHAIEGYNFIALAQRPMVLTFLHAHSKVGTYCVTLRNSGNDRSFVAEYTQAVANTWELATIKIPASPSAGTWNYTNGRGLSVGFALKVGSNFRTTPGAWQTGTFLATANQVNALDAVNNAFRLALIQIEAGNVATPFEDRMVQTELALSQRYCVRRKANANNDLCIPGQGYVANAQQNYQDRFPVTMRAAPTFSKSADADFNVLVSGVTQPAASFNAAALSTSGAFLVTANTPVAAGTAISIVAGNANAFIQYDAEL